MCEPTMLVLVSGSLSIFPCVLPNIFGKVKVFQSYPKLASPSLNISDIRHIIMFPMCFLCLFDHLKISNSEGYPSGEAAVNPGSQSRKWRGAQREAAE